MQILLLHVLHQQERISFPCCPNLVTINFVNKNESANNSITENSTVVLTNLLPTRFEYFKFMSAEFYFTNIDVNGWHLHFGETCIGYGDRL